MLKESAPLCGKASSLQEPRHQLMQMLRNLRQTHTRQEDGMMELDKVAVRRLLLELMSQVYAHCGHCSAPNNLSSALEF